MIDPRLALFAMGATFGAVLSGWPWHPRFSRYSRPAPCWQTLPPPPAPGMHRVYINSPATMAECGGPCCQAMDPRTCTCGELWVDVPLGSPDEAARFTNHRLGIPWDEPSDPRDEPRDPLAGLPPLVQRRGSNPPPPSRKPEPPASPPTFRPDWSPCSQAPNSGGYQPRPQGGTPNPPPSEP